jgi:hypothetical protein
MTHPSAPGDANCRPRSTWPGCTHLTPTWAPIPALLPARLPRQRALQARTS